MHYWQAEEARQAMFVHFTRTHAYWHDIQTYIYRPIGSLPINIDKILMLDIKIYMYVEYLQSNQELLSSARSSWLTPTSLDDLSHVLLCQTDTHTTVLIVHCTIHTMYTSNHLLGKVT